jgi:hypothetical protein
MRLGCERVRSLLRMTELDRLAESLFTRGLPAAQRING